MKNGFYAARVMDNNVQSVHVDEDTVYYLQTAKLFRQRDTARAVEEKKAAISQRKAERERRVFRKAVRECACRMGVGVLVCVAYLLGPAAVIASAVACFGAACFGLGKYFRKEKEN